ncbi:TetR/AcrR family transcriptional regulator [Humibacter soli]
MTNLPRARRLTSRGEKTRGRIIEAASELMYLRGVAATTLDDVITASSVSKSQFYGHFAGKESLVRAVIGLTGQRVMERERRALVHVSTMAGLRRWRDALVQENALRHGAYGCALGSLASEVSDHDHVAQQSLLDLFAEWQELLVDALRRIQARGLLVPTAPVDQLAIGLLSALQGGYTLAQTARDVAPLATSIDMGLGHIESFSRPEAVVK